VGWQYMDGAGGENGVGDYKGESSVGSLAIVRLLLPCKDRIERSAWNIRGNEMLSVDVELHAAGRGNVEEDAVVHLTETGL